MYLTGIERKPGVRLDEFPWNLPTFRWLERLEFNSPVTFLVGENGSGKSTLIEAIAEICGLPVSGGGKSELADGRGPEAKSALGGALGGERGSVTGV